MAPGDVAQAVAVDDDSAFRKVSGIGPKTAKLIVLSLAGKLAVARSAPRGTTPAAASVADSVLVALVGLGWNEKAAAQALDEAIAGATEAERAAVPQLLRLALTRLGPSQYAGSSSS
jgi:Holliday junction DNA helicase RuvA